MLGMKSLAQEDIRLSLFQFPYEMICHLLQLGLVDGEYLLQVLDLFEKVLRHIGHRPYSRLSASTQMPCPWPTHPCGMAFAWDLVRPSCLVVRYVGRAICMA